MTAPTPAVAGRPEAVLEAAGDELAAAVEAMILTRRHCPECAHAERPGAGHCHRCRLGAAVEGWDRALEAHRAAQASDLNSYAAHQATRED